MPHPQVLWVPLVLVPWGRLPSARLARPPNVLLAATLPAANMVPLARLPVPVAVVPSLQACRLKLTSQLWGNYWRAAAPQLLIWHPWGHH